MLCAQSIIVYDLMVVALIMHYAVVIMLSLGRKFMYASIIKIQISSNMVIIVGRKFYAEQ